MRIRARSQTLSCLFIVTFLFVAEHSVMAQSRAGIRGGISVDPEQVYFGAHVDVSEIVDSFWFRPNVEVGFGNSRTIATFNGEFVYLFTERTREWIPYFGGGPALVIRSIRTGPPGSDRDTDVGPGFNFVGGIQRSRGLLAEIKIGALDSPDFKLGIGWTW